MGYSKGIAYFIDILGSKNRNFDDSLKINEMFHEELEKVQKRHRPTSIGKRYVTSFSDCAYIIYAIKEECDKDDNFIKYIFTSLYNTASTIAYFVINGFLCRGGIYCGELYFDETKNIIFGPAINNAYLLEQKAEMPRLLLNDELAIKIIEYDKKVKSINEMARITNGNIIIQDDVDKKYYLNYLNYLTGISSVGLGTKAYTFHSFYEQAKQYSLDVISTADNYNIISKHKWHLSYLDKINNYNNNLPEMSEKEIFELILKNSSSIMSQQNGT
jgi:hypothetical protein